MNIKYLIVAFFISVLSFGQGCLKEKEMMDCVNDVVNKTAMESYGKKPFDSYEFIELIENKIVDQKLLTNTNKIEYQKLYASIIEEKSRKHRKLYKLLTKLCDDVGFDFRYFKVSKAILTNCPYIVFFENNQTEHKFMKKQIIILNKLEAHSNENIELFFDLINNIDDSDFKKIVYRAPILLLVMLNLDKKYNPDLRRHEKSKEGKKMDPFNQIR